MFDPPPRLPPAAALLAAVLVGSNWPNVATVGGDEPFGGARRLVLHTADNCGLRVHPASVLAEVPIEDARAGARPLVVFERKVRTGGLYVDACSRTTPLACALFGSPAACFAPPPRAAAAGAPHALVHDSWLAATAHRDVCRALARVRDAIALMVARRIAPRGRRDERDDERDDGTVELVDVVAELLELVAEEERV